MAKFIPIFGEIYTAIESSVLITSAGLAKIFGDDQAAKELADSAGKAWEEYTNTNLLATPIKGIVLDVQGKHEESNRLKESYKNTASSFADAIPVVGHVKGVVHYAMGDTDAGNKSMEASTRTAAVLGAGIATGGLGGGLVLGATAGITTGAVYDTTATLIDKGVNGDKASLHGVAKLADINEMNPNELVGSLMGIAGDAMTGAGGAKIGKSIKNTLNNKNIAKNSGQNKLQKTFKNSKDLKKSGVDHRTATKHTMETVQESKTAQTALKKNTSYATSKVVDKGTHESGVGHSGKYSQQMRLDKGMSKKQARVNNNYGEPSHLQNKHPNVKQVSSAPQRACAEHQAFDQLNTKNSNYSANNVNTATVLKRVDGTHVTIPRCENCSAYGPAMGTVITDFIPDGTHVPECGYVNDAYNVQDMAATGAVGCVVCRKNQTSNQG